MTLSELLHQPAAQAIGWALLQFVWQGALVGVLTAVALAVLRRSAADVRYVVATIGLAVMVTMPIVTAVQTWRSSATPAGGSTSSFVSAAAAHTESIQTAPARTSMSRAISRASGAPIQVSSAANLPQLRVEPWLPMLLALWLCGVSILSLRLLSGWFFVQRMKSHAAAVAANRWQEMARKLSRRLHITRSIRLLQSAAVDVPTVIGWLSPVVLLPTSALAGLAPHQLEAILAHELAHIRRHDYVVNLLQTLVETLLFYHPVVWWVSRRIRIERENCCDDLAVSLCGDPYTYARALASLEELRDRSGRFVLAATGGSLLQRVRRLLGAPSHAGRGPGWLAGLTAVVLIAGIAAGAIGNEAMSRSRRPRSVESGSTRTTSVPVAAKAFVREQRETVREVAQHGREIGRAFAVATRAVAHAFRDATKAFVKDAATFSARGVSGVDQLPPVPSAPPASPAPPAPPAPAAPEPAEMPAMPETTPTSPLPALPETSPTQSIPEPLTVPVQPLPPLPQEPTTAAIPAQPKSPPSVSMSTDHGQRRGNFVWSNGHEKLEVTYVGDIEFTDDDTDVKRLSPDGYLKIREGGWFVGRGVEFRADAAGNLKRRYFAGNSEKPFEPEGRQWLAQVLPRFIRQTGIGAEARVARIRNAKGPSGVLSEISLIEGSWAKRIYFSELLKTKLDPDTIRRALTQAGREIDSDFELATLLINDADVLLANEATRQAYFDAARSIDSDFEMRRTFSAALKRGPISSTTLASMLDASTGISSDFEEATLLIEVAKLQPLDNSSRGPFFNALRTVESDFEHRRVLSALAQRTDLPPETVSAMVDSATAIGSDFEVATFLLETVKHRPVENNFRDPFFRAVDSLGSAFERGRVLQAVVKRPDVPAQTLVSVLRAVRTMNSNFEASQVLMAIAQQHTLTGEARDLYIEAADKLGDFEQGRALSALVKSEKRR
jgi:beta-lactamase regulating signal transducer with metallopeptidase domain